MNIPGIGGNRQVDSRMLFNTLSRNGQGAAKASKSRADVYTPSWKQPGLRMDRPKTTPQSSLSDDMAKQLSKKYDVKNMTRDEYDQMLAELRDNGVISQWDYEVVTGGLTPAIPSGCYFADDPLVAHTEWPSGIQPADYLSVIRSYGQYCNSYADYFSNQSKDVAAEIGRDFANSYSNLEKIMQKIFDASETD